MSEHQDAFERWLNNIGDLSFVNFASPSTSKLEKRRLGVIYFLEQVDLKDTGARSLRDKLLTKLQTIKPRGVE
jgi:hypothetical protein